METRKCIYCQKEYECKPASSRQLCVPCQKTRQKIVLTPNKPPYIFASQVRSK